VAQWFGGSLLLQPAKMSLKSLGSFTVLAALISLWLWLLFLNVFRLRNHIKDFFFIAQELFAEHCCLFGSCLVFIL